MRAGCGLWPGLALIVCGVAVWVAVWRRRSAGSAWMDWLPPVLIFAGLGVTVSHLHRPLDPYDMADDATVRAMVRESVYTPRGIRAEVELLSRSDNLSSSSDALRGRALIYADSVDLHPGDLVAFPSMFEPLEGAPSWVDRMRARGIDLVVRVPGRMLRREGHIAGRLDYAARARERVGALIADSRLSTGAKGFVTALLTGSRTGLDSDLKTDFSAAGIIHILAVSGLHTGILATLLAALLWPLCLVGMRRLRLLLVAVGVWCFAVFTGMGAPVVRSAVMLSCLMLARAMERDSAALNALAFSAAIILLVDPRALTDAGFLLSFAVTAGLVVFVPEIAGGAGGLRRRLRQWWQVPLVALLCSWVFTAGIFHSVPLLALPCNMLIAPLLPAYFMASLLYVALLAVGLDPLWLAQCVETGYQCMASVADFAAGVPGANPQVWLPEVVMWLYGVALLLAGLGLRHNSRPLCYAASLPVMLAIAVMLLAPTPRPSDSFELRCEPGGCRVTAMASGNYSSAFLPHHYLSGRHLGTCRVVYVDRELRDAPHAAPLPCRWLIVGGHCRHARGELLARFAPDSIITLPRLE